jgi:hypothetical protein
MNFFDRTPPASGDDDRNRQNGSTWERLDTPSPPDDDRWPPPPPRGNGRGKNDGLPPLLSAKDFLARFKSPDYIVDGIIQRGRLYALTSPTGHGKTAVSLYLACLIAAGRNLGSIEIAQGPGVFLSGENPDDLCIRFHAACQMYGLDPDKLPIRFMAGNVPLTPEAAEQLKQEIDASGFAPTLIIVDTAAAYFDGDDDNHNVQMGAYARQLRILTGCQSNPAVVVPTHPIKNAGKDNLLPRGGGAFLNELDGNLTLWSEAMGETTTLHWQGKLRGADFAPVSFALRQFRTKLTDQRERPIMSILAVILSDEAAEKVVAATRRDEDVVLEALQRCPGISIAKIAENAGWKSDAGNPHKGKVGRLLDRLKRDKLVIQRRSRWEITEEGRKELDRKKEPDK